MANDRIGARDAYVAVMSDNSPCGTHLHHGWSGDANVMTVAVPVTQAGLGGWRKGKELCKPFKYENLDKELHVCSQQYPMMPLLTQEGIPEREVTGMFLVLCVRSEDFFFFGGGSDIFYCIAG